MRSRTAAGLAVAAVTLAVCGAFPSNSSAGGAGACLRLPQARVIENTDEAVIVRSRPRRAYYGCLKRQGRAIRIDRRSPQSVSLVYTPAGRFVVSTSYGGRTADGRLRIWLILTDLRSGAEYRVFKSYFLDDCCGSIFGVTLRDTGSIAFYSSGRSMDDKLHIYACELATCYDSRRYGTRLRDLDQAQGGFRDFRLDGDALRWTNGDDGQEKSAVLR